MLLVVFLDAVWTAWGQTDAGPATYDPFGPAEEAESEDDDTYWIRTHGILMSIAWVGLLPLGLVLAQSRWTKPLEGRLIGGKYLWFWLHVAVQVSAAALVIAAIGIAVNHMEIEEDGGVAYTHKVLGLTTFALLLLQALLGLLRPHPDQRLRPWFNLFHHNTGRLLILSAWTNIWLGVSFWYMPGGVMRLLDWVVPLAVFQGLMLLAYLAFWPLSRAARRRAAREEDSGMEMRKGQGSQIPRV